MSRLELALLGTPEVYHAGQLVRFPTRKAAALLIYLAVEGGRHSREKLAALLWPEVDADRSRGALRTTLGLLRVALQVGPEDDGRAHLAAERETLSVALSADDVLDLTVIQTALTLARGAARQSKSDVISLLRSATRSDRGDFLDGFSLVDAPAFDDWASVQREAWRRRANQVYDLLSQELSDGGALPDAIDVTARWVAREPLNETAHRRLMRLYVATRDRAAALRAYDACRSILAHELNADPSPETTALGERIRAEPLPRRGRRRDSAAPQPPEIPLIGRLSEHAALVAAYRAARRGQTSAVVVEGEAGIGKTRLASAFLSWAGAQGASILRGRVFEMGSGISYHSIVEALRSCLATIDDPRRIVADVWLAELDRLLPELRERYPSMPLPPTLGENEARTRLYDAIVRLVQALAKRGAVMLFIDDVHWADAASRELLLYAGRQWAAAHLPVLIVATSRTDEPRAAPWQSEWLSALGRDVPLTRIDLGPLTREDTVRLVQGFGVIDARIAEWLFAESRGQPFFAIEMAKALTEHGGDLPTDVAQRGLLPHGVREVIRARLARLTPNAHDVLTAAAILGTEFAFEPLRLVAGIGENDGITALDELLARRLLLEDGTAYSFGHDKIREVAYGDAGDARRRIYHRRALDALQAREIPAAELARHAHAAGLAEKAAQLSFTAGDEAMRVFAVRDAIMHYEHGLEWREKPLSASDSPLLFQLGRAHELASQYDSARAVYERVLALARQEGDPKLECAALNRLALVALLGVRSDLDTPSTVLQRALAVAEASGDVAGLAETESNLSRLSFYRSDLPATHAHGVRALALARDLGSTEAVARGLNWLGLIEVHFGQWRTAQVCAEEAVDLYRGLGDRAMEADSLVQLAAARIRDGQPDLGIAAARHAREISAEIENRWGEADANRELALGLLEKGHYGEALEAARASVAAARVAGHMPLLVICLAVYGSVCRRVGLLEEASSAHGEVLTMAEAVGYPPFVDLATSDLCADCTAVGHWAQAAAYARRATTVRSWAVSFVGFTRWYETDALVRAGDITLATDDVRNFCEAVGQNRRYRIPYLRCLAVLAVSNGDLAIAVRYLTEAGALAEELNLPGEFWSIETELARLTGDLGDALSSDAHRARAIEILKKLASSISDEAVRASFLDRHPQNH